MGKGDDLESNPTYRKYVAQVERTVAGAFEQVNEWADFITFLARLLKTLQAYPTFTIIPHKLLIAKRLAQCLNPALPTGVHQRTLDVYVHIFGVIGPDQLRDDLPVWSSGLFPFFQYAATSVRPIVLGIYSKYYIPLQESLRPCTRAIILALLPGLEEDTGESFDRVMALLDQISGTVSPSFFLQNMWLVLLTAPTSRAPALNYLLRRMPQIGPNDHLAPIVGDDVGLMIRAFATSLQDSQLLVQRGTLELLLTVLPLNSSGFRRDARNEDRVTLMRAASSVVLRRDLSLSRRLYSWLLGKSDAADEQVAYLQTFGLETAAEALLSFLRGPADEATRGFRIFLSLLDKWEIGSALTQKLALPVIAIMQANVESSEPNDDLLLSQKTLFDALDPFLVWKELFRSIKSELGAVRGTYPSVDLARFVLDAFRLQEEEVVRLHLPLVSFALIELLANESRGDQLASTLQSEGEQRGRELLLRDPLASPLEGIWEFVSRALHRLPESLFSPEDDNTSVVPVQESCLALADEVYSSSDIKTLTLPERPFGRQLFAKLVATTLRLPSGRGCLHIIWHLLEKIQWPLTLKWEPMEWLNRNLSVAKEADFGFLAALVRTLVAFQKATVSPTLVIDRRVLIASLTDRLLFFLRSEHASCLVEAAELVWVVQGMTTHRHLESVICERLASADLATRSAAYDAFGNLWRFTDDAELPGNVLAAPMFMLLDTLRSEDLETRRAGEAWMRCSLKSYLRAVDPILNLILPILRIATPHSTDIDGSLQITTPQFRRNFDAARLHHVLENLLSLARFGGQGFTRIARSVSTAQSHDAVLKKNLEEFGAAKDTYLDALCKALIALVGTEPSPTLASALAPMTAQIHATCIELLQVIVSRGDLDLAMLQSCQTTLLSRLILQVHRGHLDLQNKMLHVLHAVIQSMTNIHHRMTRKRSTASETVEMAASASTDSPETTVDPLLPKALCDGISRQTNTAIIHHWVDFLLMTATHLRRTPNQVVLPLIQALTGRLAAMVAEFEQTYDPKHKGKARATTSTDADFTVLVNALERLMVTIAEDSRAAGATKETTQERRESTDVPSSATTGGFLGYVTNVLGASEAAVQLPEAVPKVKSLVTACAEDGLGVLLAAWEVSTRLESIGTEITSQSYILSRVQARTRKALERIYKAQPGECVESLVLFWQHQDMVDGRTSRLMTLLDALVASPQTVAAHIADRATARAPVALSDKLRAFLLNPDLTDETLFSFLEVYLERLQPPLAIQVWPTLLALVKDVVLAPSSYRLQLLPIFRCFTALCERLAQTSALEDRRVRRDLQDNYVKLADATISILKTDQDTMKRTFSGTSATTIGSPNGALESVDSLAEKSMSDSAFLEAEKRPPQATTAFNVELVTYLAERFAPSTQAFHIDADKITGLCNTIVQQIIHPALRSRARLSSSAPITIFRLLTAMTKIPAALKTWRPLVIDCFSDVRFFDGPPSSSLRWKPIIHALLVADKERFLELITTVTSAKSANIFANRDLETTLRITNLRRLSFAILAGDRNRYLTQVPLIQERLVDLLRSPVGAVVHAEVFLALRVLLCRIDQQHFSGLWPVILAEMMQLFESVSERSNAENPDFLQLVLGACKFIDLLLVLQTEDFQIHQWIFTTDTVDAILPPDGYTPQAILDRLAELVGSRSKRPGTTSPALTFNDTPLPDVDGSTAPMRRPLLSGVRATNFKRLSRLETFFSSVSMSTYESTYSRAPIDWTAVEDSLDRDLFEGD